MENTESPKALTIQYASDLHIECEKGDRINVLEYIMPSADILVLAGDIGSWYRFAQFLNFLREICKMFKHVIFVAGNHEYYKVQTRVRYPMHILRERMNKLDRIIPNLHFLNRSSIKFPEFPDICIAGCTLWTKWENQDTELPPYIVRIHGLKGEGYNRMHQRDLQYIHDMIKYCQEKQMKLLLITHHPPSQRVLSLSKKECGFSCLYYTDLDHLLKKELVHTWICGHVHNNFDMITEGGTRLIGNQRGKIRDNLTDYRMDCSVNIS